MNALRGEAEAQIGSLKVQLAMTMGDLSSISHAIGASTLPELYQKLVGVEPFTAIIALRVCAKSAVDDQDKPIKKDQVSKRVSDEFSLGDQEEVQAAFSKMLLVLTKKTPRAKDDEDPN